LRIGDCGIGSASSVFNPHSEIRNPQWNIDNRIESAIEHRPEF
jgi:hypothetical protein